jgi:hypothetical protein
LEGWEFYSARRPKEWDYKLCIERAGSEAEPIELDATAWSFVLLEYPDGSREVLLQADTLPKLDADERWQAAAIVLESILGEEVLMDGLTNSNWWTNLSRVSLKGDSPFSIFVLPFCGVNRRH